MTRLAGLRKVDDAQGHVLHTWPAGCNPTLGTLPAPTQNCDPHGAKSQAMPVCGGAADGDER